MATIVIGCGGSGLATLSRLNQMLSENEHWLHDIASNVFYVAIDTEAKALKDFDRQIEQQVRSAPKPCVRSIHLSEGVTILNDVVSRYFDQPFIGAKNADGLDRLKQEWWFLDGAPFRAPCVKDLCEGAGQCPPASRLLTWWRLPEIEKNLREVIEQIKLRHVGRGGNPLRNLKVYIASGLAGGTGRGCWGLVMKKIRHLLIEEYGINVSPMAFFFDASTFKSVYEKFPDQETFMQVNSLTGLSELSWWMANQRISQQNPRDAFVYKLPHLATPTTSTTDTLVMNVKRNPNAASPIDNAFLICGGNSLGSLADHKQYHEMAGAGLYAVITCGEIKRDFVNQNAFFHSMAAATFEIDASRLSLYFESIARSRAVQRLKSSKEDFGDKKTIFFKECPLLSGVTSTDTTAFMAEEKGTLLQRILYCLVDAQTGAFRDELNGLERALKADDKDGVFAAVDGLMEVPSETKVAEAVKRACATLKQDPAELLSSMMLDEYKQSKSIAQASKLVESILSALKNDISELPTIIAFDTKDDPRPLARKLAKPEYIVFGPFFNLREQAELMQKTPVALLIFHYPLLKEELHKVLAPLIDMFSRQVAAINKIEDILIQLGAKFDAEATAFIGAKAGTDPYDDLFASSEHPEDSLPSDLDPRRYYKRTLKPVMPKADVYSLVESEIRIREELDLFLQGAIESCKANSKESLLVKLDSVYGPEQFRKELESKIKESVYLPDNFMQKNFSFMHVVESLKRAFEERLNKLSGDKQKRTKLERALKVQMGVTVEKDSDNNFRLPSPIDMLKQMSASLASHCKPWWEINGAQEQMQAVYVFLPESVENLADFQSDVEEMVEATKVEVVDASLKGARANRYAIIAFASQSVTVEDADVVDHPLQKITSVNYWNRAEVEKWITRCEDPNGKSIFSSENNNKGIGYLSPMYVRVTQISECRWKPWAEEMVDEGNRAEQEAIQALLYAFLPMSRNSAVKDALTKTGWSLPLIKDAGREKFVFTRLALKLDHDNNAEPDYTCGWEENETVSISIWQVLDFLAGKGRRDVDGSRGEALKIKGANWRQRILEEAQLFRESVAPSAGCTLESSAGIAMLKQRTRNFSAERSKATADDAATWEALVKASDAVKSQKKT